MENSVYVGNLDQSVPLAKMEELVYELFVQAGPIANIRLPYDQATGLHKTYGFVEFSLKESVTCSLSMLGGLSLYGRPLKVRAAAKNEQPTPAPASVKSAGEADAPQLPSTASSLEADERNASIEAKLQEQFGSRLSPPAPSNLLESQQQNDTPCKTLLNNVTEENDDVKSPTDALEQPPSLLSNTPNSSLPSLLSIPPPLFPPGPPCPPIGLPPPAPGFPLPPFVSLPLPPPLPLPPTSLFPNLQPAQQDPPPKELLTTPSCSEYQSKRPRHSGVSMMVPPSPLLGTLASQGCSVTASLPQSSGNVYSPGTSHSPLGNDLENGNNSGFIDSSSPFSDDNHIYPEKHSHSAEDNYRSVDGNLDLTENVENDYPAEQSFGINRNSNHKSYCDESTPYHCASKDDVSTTSFRHRGRLRQNNHFRGRRRSNRKNCHKRDNDLDFSERYTSPVNSHSWSEHVVHSNPSRSSSRSSSTSSGIEEGTVSQEFYLKRLQDIYKTLKAMQHLDDE